MSTKLTEEQYLALLNSCADNCSSPYCFFKTFLEHQHTDPRTLCQFKCVEIFKWEIGEKENRDIGYQEAGMRWCGEGWAKAFAQVYEEVENAKEIYRRTKALLELQKVCSILSSINVNSQASITSTLEIK